MCSSLFRGSEDVEKDCKILSYGDVVLYASDLYTLNPGMWLNDNIISFACEYLMSKAAHEIKEQVAIVSAASCELIRYSGDMEIVREIFFSLGFFKKEKILFILNDRDDPTIVGGNHWSLLVFDRGNARFEYYDSMRPAKEAVARQLVNTIKPALDATEVSFVIVDCPQQRNSFDCGMYVIEFVRHELKLSKESISLGISSNYIETERRHWQEIIISLSKSQYMITPVFSIVQDDRWLTFTIRAPYAKIADAEIEYGEDIFMFSSPPYFLRVHLPREVVDDNTGTAKYDSSLGEFTVRVPKRNVGENFPGLDMITELLNPQKKISAQKMVEEIRGTDDEEEDVDGNDYLIEQKVADIQAGCSDNVSDECGYGFACRRKGVLGQLSEEIGKLVELSDPEHSEIHERSTRCAECDIKAFDAERYLLDLMNPEDDLQRVITLDFGLKLNVDAEDRQRLKDFPKKRLPMLSIDEQRTAALSLIDIVFAFAYDSRINEWEACCESGWNITKLSPTLAFLCRWSNAKEAFVGSVRRSLCYPLYRNWDLSMKVVADAKHIICTGRAALLHVLCKIHGILIGSGEFRYLFNDLFITDYCLWIQSADEDVLKWLQKEVTDVEICKSDLELDLEEIELEGQMAMLKVNAPPQLDSDDEPE
ncbi:CS domain-containing protein [Trichostrongylus colubriformis]|uniref:Protein SHQ1 homolog n=1 Tax=Trichostrongylus colubriformis TaxID=6319 RepID=A0AAN8J338_TRICO